MFSLSLKNRIAFYYIITSATLIFVAFVIIYFIVSYSVYSNVNGNIGYEANEYLEKMTFKNNKPMLTDRREWEERDHNEVLVDPVFLELVDEHGALVEKSGNLKNKRLPFLQNLTKTKTSDVFLQGKLVREIQVPLYNKKVINGYLLVAVSQQDEDIILYNLRIILGVTYLIIITPLFFIARIIAGRSIEPIRNIIDTSNKITQENLNTRIDLPQNKDELYTLSQTINNLLDRVQNAVVREKQLTSDASHELRTPLAVIKGTLEVLIRKARNQSEYEEKINATIKEVDRLNNLVAEMLLLARFENQKQNINKENISVNALIVDALSLYSIKINNKKLKVNHSFVNEYVVLSDHYLVSILIGNIISNAIKYTNQNGEITITLSKENNKIICSIADTGIGIPEDDFEKVFDSFYRANASEHPEIKGTGLGLSIVKRLATLLNIDIALQSKINQGTTFIIKFN